MRSNSLFRLGGKENLPDIKMQKQITKRHECVLFKEIKIIYSMAVSWMNKKTGKKYIG